MKTIYIPRCIREDILTKYPLNAVQREAVYLFLVLRDGELCQICKHPATEDEKLEIDHIDGKKFRHFHKNLQLAHHKCNCNKDKKGSKKGIDLLVCVSETIIPQDSRSAETALKLKYYPAFIEYVTDKFKKGHVLVDIQDMTSNLFVRTGGSDETFRRYSKNICGSEGPCTWYTDKSVKPNKHYLKLKENSELYKKYMQ
ncbi:MAG: HNH endonuclease [Ignavibacteria bacterium]|nr:HNH endonuclease [Ignavibacteria bacterium]